MIVTNDITPDLCLYLLGGNLIEYIKTNKIKKIDFLELYEDIKETKAGFVSISYYIYTIDWLFLLGFLKINENGLIECI